MLEVVVGISIVSIWFDENVVDIVVQLNLLIIVVFLSISQYKGQIIPGQNPIDQQTDIFLIDDSGTRETSFVDGSGFGTGSDFGLPPIPFLALALLVIPMAMMTMMSTSETSVAPVPTTVSVTVPTTQAAVQTTPCVPTNCPGRYRLLNDQTASPNCYLDSGSLNSNDKLWSDAQKLCTTTPGAYLWIPNTLAEANAVKNTFGFGTDFIWTGGNSPTHDENYVFAGDNTVFSLFNVPFGAINIEDFGQDCFELNFSTTLGEWEWENEECDDKNRFICEFPRQTCP
ncbi:unnamed protein product [Mytilus coruscus]|uniref:C-type lectin domain-containing protein n=1 Tax=Mytilus coruscus TaxID=42192 RepID=A0A6J8C2G7_MYTCO|nr:unnamed protein product [Mytilus coruscus]